MKPDEEALLKRISATNLKAEGIDAFIYKQIKKDPSVDYEGEDRMIRVDEFIPKIRIEREQRVLA